MTAMASRHWSEPDDSPVPALTPLHEIEWPAVGHVEPAHLPSSTPARTDHRGLRSATRSGDVTVIAEPRLQDRVFRGLGHWPPARRNMVYMSYAKRPADVVLALLLITILMPLMLAIAAMILVDSRGSVLYTQSRLGHRQTPFTMLKFRSMFHNSDAILLLHPEQSATYATNWKVPQDPRVTRLGSFLRKASLDELPQLFNVLRGDMSIVGPRPYLSHELADAFGAHADAITSVKPGMTGLWQVSGRSLLSPAERIELDELYVQTCSARLDARILVKTFKVVVKSYGAF